MEKKNTAGNVIGIILAWPLSIILVIVLLVTPMLLSATSLMNPDTIAEAVTEVLSEAMTLAGQKTSAPSYSVNKLSETKGEEQGALGGALEEIFGDDMSPELLGKILSSKAAKELIELYVEDVTNAFTGSNEAPKLDAENLKNIVKDNIDEVVAIVKELDPNISEADLAEVKDGLLQLIDEKAGDIVNALPDPVEIREEVLDDTPELEIAFKILAKKDTIKLAVIALVVVLCGLIFLCRMSGFRGLRWIAIDLFIGGGFNAMICGGMFAASSTLTKAMAGQAALTSVVELLVSSYLKGMVVTTVVLLVVGGASLTGYILLSKFTAKKAEAV